MTDTTTFRPLDVVMAPLENSFNLFPALICPDEGGEDVLQRVNKRHRSVCVQFFDQSSSRAFVDVKAVRKLGWTEMSAGNCSTSIGLRRGSRSQTKVDEAVHRAREAASLSYDERRELMVDDNNYEDDDNNNKPKDVAKSKDDDPDYTGASSQSSEDDSSQDSPRPSKRPRNDGSDDTKTSGATHGLSEYEQLRLRNIAQRQQLMMQLGFAQEKKRALITIPNDNGKSTSNKTKPVKSVKKEVQEQTRRSARLLQLRGVSTSIDHVVLNDDDHQKSSLKDVQTESRSLPQRDLSLDECLVFQCDDPEGKQKALDEAKDALKQFRALGNEFEVIMEVKEDEKPNFTNDLHKGSMQGVSIDSYNRSLNNYSVCHTSKVTPTRISALSLHRSEMVVAAADKRGHIALLSCHNDNQDVFNSLLLQTHEQLVRCLHFDKFNSELHSASYDGSLRSFDLHSYQSVLSYHDEASVISFVAQSEHQLHWLGFGAASTIGLLDKRAASKSLAQSIKAFESGAVKSVDVHCLQSNMVLCASGNGTINIFDTRKPTKPLTELVGHKRSVESAFFSPLTGKKVCSLSHDNTIKLFNTSSLSSAEIQFQTSIVHDNHTGRWLTPFKARWHPQREDVVLSGSMKHPRHIDVFQCTSEGKAYLVKVVQSDLMDTVPCLVEAHAKLPMLVGANASGKVFIFKE